MHQNTNKHYNLHSCRIPPPLVTHTGVLAYKHCGKRRSWLRAALGDDWSLSEPQLAWRTRTPAIEDVAVIVLSRCVIHGNYLLWLYLINLRHLSRGMPAVLLVLPGHDFPHLWYNPQLYCWEKSQLLLLRRIWPMKNRSLQWPPCCLYTV